MADSDSDHFESADEDFSDSETIESSKTRAAVKESPVGSISQRLPSDGSVNSTGSSTVRKVKSVGKKIDAPSVNEKVNQSDESKPTKLESSAIEAELDTSENCFEKPSSLPLEARDGIQSEQETSSGCPNQSSTLSASESGSQKLRLSEMKSENDTLEDCAKKLSSLRLTSEVRDDSKSEEKIDPSSSQNQSSVAFVSKSGEAILESNPILPNKLTPEKLTGGSQKTSKEEIIKQLKLQPATESETSHKSKLGFENNFTDTDLEASSWNEGWETEDFEVKDEALSSESINASKEKNPVLDSIKTEGNEEDADWNAGWDTEEISVVDEQLHDQFALKKELSKSNQPKLESEGAGLSLKYNKNEASPTSIPVQGSKQDATETQLSKNVQGTSVLNDGSKTQSQQDGWFGWGVTNILSSATEGFSSITNNVSTVFESTIGAPDPELLLRAQKEARLKEEAEGPEATVSQEETPGFADNLFSVSSWTKFVESTGSKVLSTGLDTLETIGKKTMEVLQEGDPGLKKKRAKLREFVSEPGKPVLSQILREAKEKAETSSSKNEEALIASRANFEILFDDFGGLVHLEALEMISKQCQIKLESLALSFSGEEAKNFKETLDEIEEFCELPEDDESNSKDAVSNSEEFLSKVKEVLDELKIEVQFDKLSQTSTKVENSLKENHTNSVELHQIVISSLAEISAAAMQIFHRAAEMLVIKSKHSTVAETESLMGFGKLMCSKLDVTAEKFSSKLKTLDPHDTTKVSHILKEASNSTSYIQTACRLCLPILQYGAVA